MALARYTKHLVFSGEFAPVMVGRWLLDYDIEPHAHDFMEIAFVMGGEGIHHSMLGTHSLMRGKCILIRPGAWHSYTACQSLDIYNCCFGMELLHRELAWMRENSLLNTLLWGGLTSLNQCGTLMVDLDLPVLKNFSQVLRVMEAVQHKRIEALGYLVVLIAQLAEQLALQDDVLGKDRASKVHDAVLRVIQIIESDIRRDWSIEELANLVNLAPSYLIRIFKHDTAQTPIAFMIRCRVEQAVNLLLHTNDTIAQVAEAVGWDDPNYFTRRFRDYFGLSPSGYRKQFAQLAAARSPVENENQ